MGGLGFFVCLFFSFLCDGLFHGVFLVFVCLFVFLQMVYFLLPLLRYFQPKFLHYPLELSLPKYTHNNI